MSTMAARSNTVSQWVISLRAQSFLEKATYCDEEVQHGKAQ